MKRSIYPTLLLCILCVFFAQETSAARNDPGNQPMAATRGECLDSFEAFAFFRPVDEEWKAKKTLPGEPWQMVAEIPPHEIEGFYEHYGFFNIAFARSIHGSKEIWLIGEITSQTYSERPIRMIIIYRPDRQEWEFIPTADVDDTDLQVSTLLVDDAGTVWGRVTWKPATDYPNIDAFPVLSRFNEDTRRFEFAENALEIPLVTEIIDNGTRVIISDHCTRIVLSETNTFWIFAQEDGIYRYDAVTESIEKVFDLPDAYFGSPKLSPEGSIYFTKVDSETNREGYFMRTVPDTLFELLPETKKILPVEMPDDEWPFFNGLLVDSAGRLWLGSIGYRDFDGVWHLLHPAPQFFFDIVDGGSYSYVWGPPWPILESSDGTIWFMKFHDAGAWIDGIAWYDPETGTGCQFTTVPSNIVEDSEQTLWLLADGALYAYPLNRDSASTG